MATLFAWWKMLNDEQSAISDSGGADYDLAVTTNGSGFPKRGLWPNLPNTSAREFSRAFEGSASGNVTTDHIAEAAITPEAYAAIAEGDWSTTFWFRRRPTDAGETSSAGTVLCIQGADSSTSGAMRGLIVRYLNQSSGGVFQTEWSNYNGLNVSVAAVTFPGFNPVVGQWCHVAIVRTLEASVYRSRLYIDGACIHSNAASLQSNANVSSYPPSAARITVGAERRWISGPGVGLYQPLNGCLYDLRLYSGALTQAEVATLFRDSVTPWGYQRNVPHG